jgi:hypothetical protein
MKVLLAVLILLSFSARAQPFEQFVLNETSPWHHDSQYISSIAEDGTSITFSSPLQVQVKPNKIYSHLEFKVQQYDNNVLLTAQLIKRPEMNFVNTLIQDHYRYYKITFTNGLVYTYQEPYNTTYADKNIFILLKGAMASNNKKATHKADTALYALMCKLPVKSIQPFEAHYNPDTRKKGAYEAKETYILTEDTARQLMHELL